MQVTHRLRGDSFGDRPSVAFQAFSGQRDDIVPTAIGEGYSRERFDHVCIELDLAGLVAVTPASGFAGPMGSIVLGLVAGMACFIACTSLKNAIGYDDSLDVFGVHCVGGIIGAIATGILVNPALGGAGIPDYETKPGELVAAAYEFGPAVMAQVKAVAFTLAYSGIVSAILFKIIDLVIGLRVPQEQEREGLDIASHGERAYNL